MDLVAIQVSYKHGHHREETLLTLCSRVPYGGIDLIYGTKAFDANDGFTNAQGEPQSGPAVLTC